MASTVRGWTRLKSRSIFWVAHVGAGTHTLGPSFGTSPGISIQQETGLKMESLELKFVPIWDTDITDGGLNLYATILPPGINSYL